MTRVFDKDITYRKYRGGNAIRRFRDKYAESFPDIKIYLDDDMIAYLIQYDDITYSDIRNADGSINHNWTYSINYENGDDYTYISLTVREPETTKYNPGTVSENEYINAKTGNKTAVPELWNPDRRRCSYSNEKTGGIPSVSILAGSINANYSGAIPWNLKTTFNVCGTCSADCPGCYAKKLTRYPDKYIQLALNTIEAKTDPVRFFELVEKELFRDPWTDPRVVRLHDSGEFFSIEYFSAAMDFINRHPGTVFGTYSKEAEIINEYGINNLPGNLCLSCSPWKGYCEPVGDLPQFIYDDGTDPEIAALKHCPAVDKNGKKTGVHCMQCKHCYTAKRGSRIAVYAH